MEIPVQSGNVFSAGNLYTRRCSREHRCCLIFLLDQSGSMSVPVQGQSSNNIGMATATLNDLLKTVVENAGYDLQTGKRKDYCDLFIFGYGDEVHSLLSQTGEPVSVVDLADHPRGVQEVVRDEQDRATGRVYQVRDQQPYWIQPFATSQRTEMAWALSYARDAAQRWIAADPRRLQSFPPLVFNITDGEHNGQGDPIAEATELRRFGTEQGQILLFNCHLTSAPSRAMIFPFDVSQVRNLGPGAEQLFQMASPIPDAMIMRARNTFNIEVPAGAHGFIYNADPKDLVNFLNWGTRQTQTNPGG